MTTFAADIGNFMKKSLITFMLTIVAMVGFAQDEINRILPSCWSDERGIMTIAFFDNGVFYDNRFWEYKWRIMNTETGESKMIITDGDEKLRVTVGKIKKGRCTIKIGKKKMTCSQIPNKYVSDSLRKKYPERFLYENYRQ